MVGDAKEMSRRALAAMSRGCGTQPPVVEPTVPDDKLHDGTRQAGTTASHSSRRLEQALADEMEYHAMDSSEASLHETQGQLNTDLADRGEDNRFSDRYPTR